MQARENALRARKLVVPKNLTEGHIRDLLSRELVERKTKSYHLYKVVADGRSIRIPGYKHGLIGRRLDPSHETAINMFVLRGCAPLPNCRADISGAPARIRKIFPQLDKILAAFHGLAIVSGTFVHDIIIKRRIPTLVSIYVISAENEFLAEMYENAISMCGTEITRTDHADYTVVESNKLTYIFHTKCYNSIRELDGNFDIQPTSLIYDGEHICGTEIALTCMIANIAIADGTRGCDPARAWLYADWLYVCNYIYNCDIIFPGLPSPAFADLPDIVEHSMWSIYLNKSAIPRALAKPHTLAANIAEWYGPSHVKYTLGDPVIEREMWRCRVVKPFRLLPIEIFRMILLQVLFG